MKTKSKALLLTLCAVLLVAASVLGTMAYLTSTDTVTNTFTVGKVEITLDETDVTNPNGPRVKANSYKLMPGTTYTKDPTVTVKGGSEACYLFVKVEKEGTFAGISYEIADGWTELESGVYYRLVDAVTADTSFAVIKGNEITVSSDLTKENIPSAQPKLTFTAYAVQKENIPNAAAAWEAANPATTTNP